MEKFQELRDISKKKIWLADHILTQTYPLLKDPHLLLSSLETLFLAYANSIGALLHYERQFNRIPEFKEDFDSKLRALRDNCAKRYLIKQEDINMIKEIRDIIVQHKKSPVEFVREDRFIICSDDYSMKTINVDKLKTMLATGKVFIDKVNYITSKDESIFKRR
jgi:hypothetical protein